MRRLITAFLCMSACGGLAMAQTLQPKGAPSEAAQAPAAGAPAAPSQGWQMSCDSTTGDRSCRVTRSLVSKTSKRPIVTVFLAVSPDTKQPIMMIRLPLGIYLPAGASVQIGQDAARPLELQRCGTSGCYGKYGVTAADVAAMLKGSDLTINAESRDRKPLQYVVRAEGLPQAYAKLNQEPAPQEQEPPAKEQEPAQKPPPKQKPAPKEE